MVSLLAFVAGYGGGGGSGDGGVLDRILTKIMPRCRSDETLERKNC